MKKGFISLLIGLAISGASQIQAQTIIGSSFESASNSFELNESKMVANNSRPRSDFASCNDAERGALYVESTRKIIIYGFKDSNIPSVIRCAELRDTDGDGAFSLSYDLESIHPNIFNINSIPTFDQSSQSIIVTSIDWFESEPSGVLTNFKYNAEAKLVRNPNGTFYVDYVTITN